MGRVCQIRLSGIRLADRGECCTELTTRTMEDAYCLWQVTAMQEQHSELDAAICRPQCLARLLAAATGKPREYAFAAPYEFLVDGLEIHHEALVDPAQQDHDDR